MKKRIINAFGIVLAAVLLTACANNQSKVNQVLQNQIDATYEQADNTIDGENNGNDGNVDNVGEGTSGEGNAASDHVYVCDVEYDNIDVDLTVLSSTMVYSEVYNMVTAPEGYMDKVVKMKGTFVLYENINTDQIYFACIISDATACCAQGIEYLLAGNAIYPEDYPELESEITITGVFETYDEDGYTYIRLRDAVLE